MHFHDGLLSPNPLGKSLSWILLEVSLGNRGSTPLASKCFVINYLQRLDDNRCDNTSIVVRYYPQGFMQIYLDLFRGR